MKGTTLYDLAPSRQEPDPPRSLLYSQHQQVSLYDDHPINICTMNNQSTKSLSKATPAANTTVMPTCPQQCRSSSGTDHLLDPLQYLCADAQERVWQKSEVEGEAGRDLVSLDVQTGDPLDTP